MSLDEIAAVLAGPEHSRGWRQIVAERRKALDTQIEQMTTARDYLDHLLTCPRQHSLDGCPEFEHAIQQPVTSGGSRSERERRPGHAGGLADHDGPG
ncbi:MerR family DNA-binding protein [Tsukamurella soli]|uniref:Transcription regulator MerR DNA binding domain-containing protein n=1 Tax=Tsukamurella soli TaxID=644556 RepID=A0ABP8K7W6_9ACTN